MTISHIKPIGLQTYKIQSNDEHLNAVADFAESFASEFGMGVWGRAIGLLHDKGKEKNDFQNYIKTISGYSERPLQWKDKSHAYVGALLAKKIYGAIGDMMTNQIAGHHTGLYDYTELEEILRKPLPEEVEAQIEQIPLSIDRLRGCKCEEVNHLFRMLYSCLVDADFLDTERFMSPDSFAIRANSTTMQELRQMLNVKLISLSKCPDTPVNRIRRQVQGECLKASALPSGFFSLTVPTGGGKTISSIVWAVNHAINNEKKRIIIAIPYTSIIVQTAAVLKGIFGENNVLEHHSNYDYENVVDERLRQQIKLATENWNYPIIVTTNVQLFESIYSNKPSDCRKLHNICNSVVILDEVQTLPIGFLQPIVDALKCFQRQFGVSVLLTTASQPVLDGVIEGCNPRANFTGIGHIQEIIPADMHLHDSLRRVVLDIDDEGRTYDEVAAMLSRHRCVLCIVNTRNTAKEIYDRLPDEGIKLHLSRMMCPAHIRETIDEIKAFLLDDGDSIIRVIATQLIEAGVDIDFPVVYRQESGLDSVLQAAGRCNREGKSGICTTYVFSLGKEGSLPPGHISTANNARKNIIGERDWFSPDTMKEYFRQLYCRESFDIKKIKEYLYRPAEMCFESASREFRLIDDDGINVVVNWGDIVNLIEQAKIEGISYRLMKQLSQFCVSVRKDDFEKMKKEGLVEEVIEGLFVAPDKSQYSESVGLLRDNHWMEEILII